MPQYEGKRSAMYRRKWAKYPKIPQDLQNLEYNNEIFTKIVLKERFLLVDCYENDQRITIFSSDNQMVEFGTSNPNVWVCIEGVQKEELYTSVNYVQVSTGIKKSRKNEVVPEYK